MADRNYITVEELNFYINNVFKCEELLHNVPVVGEVSGCSVAGGHCYFTLKDSQAQISVCLFNCHDKYVPHNGEKVLVRGSVDYYSKRGTINIKAYEVTFFGVGLLSIQFNELKDKLEKEGYFKEEYKKPIPSVLNRIAIITSTKGAAIQDFLTTVRRKNQMVDITIVDVRVQGEYCVSDIITALNNCDNEGFDIIIVARGGGSYEDLFCFNDESLVKTIFNMDTPVVSAVGHETDYTLCDFVADYRAITPTAAGELVAKSAENLYNAVSNYITKISLIVNNMVENCIEDFVDNCDSMQNNIKLLIQNQYAKIQRYLEKTQMLQKSNFERNSQQLSQNMLSLETLNPLKLLKMGYFRIVGNKKYLSKVKEMKKNDVITIVGIDGKVNAIITDGGQDELRE